jgi:hypothetical protein
MINAAAATPVRAKRPENVKLLFKASPNKTRRAPVRFHRYRQRHFRDFRRHQRSAQAKLWKSQ